MIGKILKEKLKVHGVNSKFIVEQTGLTPGAVSLILNDKTDPRVSTLERVASALGYELSLVKK